VALTCSASATTKDAATVICRMRYAWRSLMRATMRMKTFFRSGALET
jgi:hypothetical protein